MTHSQRWWPPMRKKTVLTLIWTLLYFLITPLILLHAFPVYIFRLFVQQLAKIVRPDLAQMVHTRSAVLARENWKKNPNWNLVVWLTQEGILDLNKFRQSFYDEHVNRREDGDGGGGDDNSGPLRYPEYQQHYTKFFGFLFWRWDPNFDIKNHIRPYDGIHSRNSRGHEDDQEGDKEVVDEDGLVQIINELTWKPWHPTRSPWEFLQIKNYEEKKHKEKNCSKKSILIFRIHHGLGDGYYILKLLMEDICGVSLKTALGKPKYVQRNFLQKIIIGILFWIRAPYQFVKMFVAADDSNAWHLTRDKMIKPMKGALTDPIPLDEIKLIKNRHGVSFTAVMAAAITGGIRNLMLSRGVVVPSEMHTGVAVPMPNHPPKLRNHFIFSFIELPISIPDPLARLRKMDSIYTTLKQSTTPLLTFAKLPLIGALPASWIAPACVNRLTTCLISNFPGGSQLLNFKGVKVLDMMFNAGLGEGSTGLGFCLLSYLDHIRLFSEADPGILPRDLDVQELNRKILEELEIFKKI